MTETTKILRLEHIAAWWLPDALETEGNKEVRATLPSLQRGFVWKSTQIEMLWDSIAQGFPIGSLLLSEYESSHDKVKETTMGQGSSGLLKNPNYLILDGQQRATAIALGFRDIWSEAKDDSESPISALWVDLVKLNKGGRRFAFRVVTKAHPWGYRRIDHDARLTAANARDALEVYRHICGRENQRPHELELSEVFPWDAVKPVPLALLVKSIGEANAKNKDVHREVAEILHKKLQATSIWKKLESYGDNSNEALKTAKTKIQSISDLLGNKISEKDEGGNGDFKELVVGLRHALRNTEVPASVLMSFANHTAEVGCEEFSDNDVPIFNLFKRINSGGTSLTREEINYSMLKAVWPEAKHVIEDELLGHRKIAHPARMASLMTRLFLMMETGDGITVKMQAELSISQFRIRLHSREEKFREFKVGLENFCKNKGPAIVETLWDILTNKENGMPVVLAAQFSQKADDLLLLLMYWLSLVGEAKVDLTTKARTLGFITAVSWFAEDLNRCVKRLMEEMATLDKSNINDKICFFNNQRFQSILERDHDGRVLMKPLPSPDVFQGALIEGISNEALDSMESDMWSKKSFWDHYRGPNGDKVPSGILEMYGAQFSGENILEHQRIAELWWAFFDRVTKDKRFILYAQRKIMEGWFDWFDPTLPDQTRDHNQPWDYDHILPYSWAHHPTKIRTEVAYLVRLWVNVNGNFRAWPLELNRSKSNVEIIETKIEKYGLNDIDAVCDASFIGVENKEAWTNIESSLHGGSASGKAKRFREKGGHWKLFIKASRDRTADIYKEWYERLLIADLMK